MQSMCYVMFVFAFHSPFCVITEIPVARIDPSWPPNLFTRKSDLLRLFLLRAPEVPFRSASSAWLRDKSEGTRDQTIFIIFWE